MESFTLQNYDFINVLHLHIQNKLFDIIKAHWAIVAILIVAIIVIPPFGFIQSVPFNYDEVSQFIRADKYPSFTDQIKYGIMPDGHPAGMQLLVWFLYGKCHFSAVVLQFIVKIFALVSILVIYLIGKKEFNVFTGIFGAGWLAFSIWPLHLIGQIRPYCLPLGFVLISVYFFLLFKEYKLKKYLIVSLTTALLAMYFHYFAGLSIFIFYLLQLFNLDKSQIKRVLIFGTITATIFLITHGNITLAQTKQGGLDWLGKPSYLFSFEHLLYIFNNRIWLCVFAISVALCGLIYLAIKKKILTKKLIPYFIFFLLPIYIGYLYSIIRKPLLQHNVLLFSSFAFVLITGYGFSFFRYKIISVLFAFVFLFISVKENLYFSVYKRDFYNYASNLSDQKGYKEKIFFYGAEDVLNWHKKIHHCTNLTNDKNKLETDSFIYVTTAFNHAVPAEYYYQLIRNNYYPWNQELFIGAEVIRWKKNSTVNVQYTIAANTKMRISTDEKVYFASYMIAKKDTIDKVQIVAVAFNGNDQSNWRNSVHCSQQGDSLEYTICIKTVDLMNRGSNSEILFRMENCRIPIEKQIIYLRMMDGNKFVYGW